MVKINTQYQLAGKLGGETAKEFPAGEAKQSRLRKSVAARCFRENISNYYAIHLYLYYIIYYKHCREPRRVVW